MKSLILPRAQETGPNRLVVTNVKRLDPFTNKADEILLRCSALYLELIKRLPSPGKWFPDLTDSFALLDLEATGVKLGTNLITTVGICPVHGGQADLDSTVDVTIQTPYDPVIWDAAYLKPDFAVDMLRYGKNVDNIVKEAIDLNNGTVTGLDPAIVPEEIQKMDNGKGRLVYGNSIDITGITPQDTMERGVPRDLAMQTVASLLRTIEDEKHVLVGHNICGFDIPRIFYEIKHFAGIEPAFDDNLVLDTGLTVKAAQVNEWPLPNDSLWDFFHRMSNQRRRVRWALDTFCVPTFGLDKKYEIDTEKQHMSAAYDCWVTLCLLREIMHS